MSEAMQCRITPAEKLSVAASGQFDRLLDPDGICCGSRFVSMRKDRRVERVHLQVWL